MGALQSLGAAISRERDRARDIETLSLQAKLAKALISRSLKGRRMSIGALRKKAARLHPFAHAFKGDAAVSEKRSGGVRALEIVPAIRSETLRAAMHLHGGGYVWGSPETHLSLSVQLAKALGATVLVPEYALAPESPYPAALRDAVAAWEGFARASDDATLILSGDSAGGGLALSLALELKATGKRLPDAIALMSPWTDLTCSFPSHERNAASEIMLDTDTLLWWASLYANGVDPRDPSLSPAFADLSGFPPLLIQVGSGEIFLDDAKELARVAEECGVDVSLSVWHDLWHVWQLLGDMLPESGDSLEEIAGFIATVESRNRRGEARNRAGLDNPDLAALREAGE